MKGGTSHQRHFSVKDEKLDLRSRGSYRVFKVDTTLNPTLTLKNLPFQVLI